ncbi:MAG: tryptophan--tRNA ligase [Bdellovibrionaceae bacterium]|nr:tryptophan--tRNA ligase [Pseudobdellovibrionaceae bacterium]
MSETVPKRRRVISGKRVSGRLHIGHWWGTIRSWVELQHQHDCFFGAMDWHGLTSEFRDPRAVGNYARENLAEYIAWGLDPEKCTLFIQSRVPEVIELYMIFSMLTPMGWLERVNTWKDAEEELKQKDMHNLGRFGYPVLQTADIAIFFGQMVPIGKDQAAHLEISREIIRRFNHLYKAKLPEPQPLYTDTPLLTGIDGRKMSTSYDNFIAMTEESEKTLRKKVNAMLTDTQRVRREDPGEPTKCTVYGLHRLYSVPDLPWVETGCRSAGIGCGDCKGRLVENMEKTMAVPREKKKELLNNPKHLDSIIEAGCEKARTEARKTLAVVRSHMKW